MTPFWSITLYVVLPIVWGVLGIAALIFFFRALFAISDEINSLKNEIRALRKTIDKANKKKDE